MNEDEVLSCDVCGEVIEVDDIYYEMPDGVTVCADSECLHEWAWEYRRQRAHPVL